MPSVAEALNQARQLVAAGQLPRAEALYRQILASVPAAAEVWHELALVCARAGQPEAAVEALEKATSIDPSSAAYHSNLGALYRLLKRRQQAVTSFQRAVECSPAVPELRNNLALALKDEGRVEESLSQFDEALRLRGDYANGYFNRGNLLLEIGRLDEAIDSYQRALQLNPRDAGVPCKLGVAYYDQLRMAEAEDAFLRALAIQPHYPEVRRNLGLVYLARGDYQRGWSELEWRTECDDFPKRHFAEPRWDGSPLAGRTLLAHAEQGLGDTLHLIRYVPLAARGGGHVQVEVQDSLRPLLTLSGFGPWLVDPAGPARFDVQCPLMSLPRHLPDGSGQPYWDGPYLAAEPRLVDQWRERLAGIAGFKIGIVWAGNPDHPHDRFRSVRLAEFEPLARVPGVSLISLQKGAARGQLADSAHTVGAIDLGQSLDESAGAFMDTAAVVRHLDLVVAVDTSLAHLAGGMGARVWVPLHLSPDWRWLASGDTTPWYPTMRLFRQSQFDCWPAVFNEMAQALGQLVADKSASAAKPRE